MLGQSKIIGVGGISRSGKSFLAGKLAGLYTDAGLKVSVLDQDDYVYPESQIPLYLGHIDWEIPESIDFVKFKEAIVEEQERSEIVIVEGLMIFWNPQILELLSHKIFITLSKEEFVARKQMDLRWGKEPDWYIEHIWNAHLRYGQYPINQTPDIVLDGESLFQSEEIFAELNI